MTTYRSNVLPDVVDGWSDLNIKQQEKLKRLMIFFVEYILLQVLPTKHS